MAISSVRSVRSAWSVLETPVGPLRLVARAGALAEVRFAPWEPIDCLPRVDAQPVLVETARQLTAYFDGELTDFDLPLAPSGSDFQREVWAELVKIPFGDTATYGQIARRIGRTNAASRAVGLANGSNPVPVIIPCHRVVGADGTMTGYGGGLERKLLLLGLENAALF